MDVKLFELRDKGTFVPAIAIKLYANNEAERYLLWRAGYGQSNSEQQQYVLLAGLEGGKITYDQYDWGANRTRQVAHDHIIKYFDELISGQVIDVEYVLGETTVPKDSEANSAPLLQLKTMTDIKKESIVAEQNEIIAKFMGAKKMWFQFEGYTSARAITEAQLPNTATTQVQVLASGRSGKINKYYQRNLWQMHENDLCGKDTSHLKYHSSWDWQVPVAAKAMDEIRGIYLKNGGVDNNQEFKIAIDEWMKGAVNNDISHSYKMLVNIIKAIGEYNQQSAKPKV